MLRSTSMRHFAWVSLAVAPLLSGMSTGSPGGALIASAGTVHRLPANLLRAISRAVEVPAITLRADAHLHPAATAMVEPVGCRRLEQPQDPLPDSTGQRRGEEA